MATEGLQNYQKGLWRTMKKEMKKKINSIIVASRPIEWQLTDFNCLQVVNDIKLLNFTNRSDSKWKAYTENILDIKTI